MCVALLVQSSEDKNTRDGESVNNPNSNCAEEGKKEKKEKNNQQSQKNPRGPFRRDRWKDRRMELTTNRQKQTDRHPHTQIDRLSDGQKNSEDMLSYQPIAYRLPVDVVRESVCVCVMPAPTSSSITTCLALIRTQFRLREWGTPG